ncbi:Type II secretory pathway ATPase GspE/PulE or T4P pilus assembly pathway ATPase PilB [Pseudomonas asturiensis]|uniref:Type II secretory pathway ATPase GspE/PulE or T4P pilus assembly pathway ATPase PilB n=1 Tax=Pseudomonas asturiensis TaxID=1190415 RepID=A0A1M7P7M5_9PSED|nr:ATPase, T2SS/T4P/T4SS family [Pseudomonas asturiensis]SHN12617.1 Type II secretory pathway ATPase GspE/PulE or T4P pilus assembly pathway ATPase PilB [Pseudomonas asturiensis]
MNSIAFTRVEPASTEDALDLPAIDSREYERLLTSPGNTWELSAELRQLCALTASGQLYVSSQHLNDHYVMALMDRLERSGMEFTVHKVTMSDIKAMYQAHSSADDSPSGKMSNTQRQQAVIKILGQAHQRDVSDVHFVVGHEITHILFREHGLLSEFAQIPTSIGIEYCSALYNTMCDVQKEHYQPAIPQDARVSRTYVDQLGLFGARVATRPLVEGPLMVLRLLSDDKKKQSLQELGFLPEQIRLMKRLYSLPYGVVLVTGPTGSGKSKSLQILINLIATESKGTKHILTVEDPPEYPLMANQSPKGNEETWDSAITNSMRLDPDVLMYGEIRDLASAQAAFRGGMTGHLVKSTLHTNNAVGSLQRLQDMGVDQSLVTDPALMAGIINQSLLPVLCKGCRVRARDHLQELDDDLKARLLTMTHISGVYLHGAGCADCRGLGVTDRTAVGEVLVPTQKFMRIFREHGAGEARNYWVNEMGGITKTAHALMKINDGMIDPRMAETIIGPLDFDRFVLEQQP